MVPIPNLFTFLFLALNWFLFLQPQIFKSPLIQYKTKHSGMGFVTNSFIADCLRGAALSPWSAEYWLLQWPPMGLAMENVNTAPDTDHGSPGGRASSQGSCNYINSCLVQFLLGKRYLQHLRLQRRNNSPPLLELWVCAIIWARERLWYFRMLAPSWENVEMIIDRTFLQFWRVSKPRLGLSEYG